MFLQSEAEENSKKQARHKKKKIAIVFFSVKYFENANFLLLDIFSNSFPINKEKETE